MKLVKQLEQLHIPSSVDPFCWCRSLNPKPPIGIEPTTSSLPRTCSANWARGAGKWAALGSNQRRLASAGLQPAPFGHSGSRPFQVSDNQKIRIQILLFLSFCSSDDWFSGIWSLISRRSDSNWQPTVYKTVAHLFYLCSINCFG